MAYSFVGLGAQTGVCAIEFQVALLGPLGFPVKALRAVVFDLAQQFFAINA
jgi:hypothetical protein